MLALSVLAFPAGCASPFEAIDRGLAVEARMALRQERPPASPVGDEEEEGNIRPYDQNKGTKSVILGELLAIFPGFFWHGLGHTYAGDHKTAREIRGTGEWGYLLTALGGGLLIGGYFLDQEDSIWNGYAISLYVTGGVAAGVGAGFWLTAWFYDMIDTPRAVESGGRPPPSSPFGKDMEDIQGR
jgi:hypothetical protein